MAYHCIRILPLLVVFVICGCYHPPPYGGYYGQPQYIPPQPGYTPQPGTIVVPPSNDPLQAPGTPADSYDDDYEEPDGFRPDSSSDEGSFFGGDDDVPLPDDGSGTRDFNSDFRGN